MNREKIILNFTKIFEEKNLSIEYEYRRWIKIQNFTNSQILNHNSPFCEITKSENIENVHT